MGDEVEPQALDGEHYGDGDDLPARGGLGASVVLLVLLFSGLGIGWSVLFDAVHESFLNK